MALAKATIKKLAEHLDSAHAECRDVVKITDEHPGLTLQEAYDIQAAQRVLKLGRGSRIAGHKAGLTSRAKMKQMGVETPCFGFVTDDMVVPEGGTVATKQLIHPKVEAEICVVTRRELKGPGCHLGTVLSAIELVLPGIEVIDSRYRDFKFDLPSVIADNTSASRFVLGGRSRRIADVDLRTLGVVLEKNGVIVAMAAGAAVLGHPAAAVVMLVNHLAERGEALPAGTLVLTGGVTEAIPVAAGDSVLARFQDLGSVSLRFE